jgi:hypothetical protein
MPARHAAYDYSVAPTLLTTRKTPLQCKTTRLDGVMLLAVRNVAGRQDRTYATSLKTSCATPSH